MSQCWKSPLVNGNRDGGMTPFRTPPQRHDSPKHWSSPHQNRQSRNWSSSPSNWSPQHYNSSPDGYWGHQRQWSPNQWDPASNYHRSWGFTPKTPQYSPSYKQSPEHGSVYPERKKQVHFRRNLKDIGIYYSPSMVEDPWAELEAKATVSAGSK
ncbi:gastrula-specific protein 17-like [Hyla sarda]|uniref:gastrula-specific protein 17-like n=1 Tax=Hyla sarda TaxID=327740 RepID=UPI0024C26290|nr:gastrula-specific protein 17-like [Hyla sarda]XP_056403479.1 gastrula-specific protein 17-like [Hyla sarda]